MKRFTIITALLIMAMPMMAERVTTETARKVATTFLNNNGAKTAQLTDLSKAAGFSNLYIFTAEQSFVVMSADDCVKPILGYSLTGSFDIEDMPDNVHEWLNGYNNEIGYAINSKMSASAETLQLWKILSEGMSGVAKANVVVSPLIETKWNQNKYYNDSCPAASGGPNGHAHTGCVATAMAQIMKYWEFPSRGIGSHSYTWNNQTLSADFGATTYDWSNMGLYYNYYFDDAHANSNNPTWLDAAYHTDEKVAAVATLMYHCGVSVDMKYSGNSSSTPTLYVVDALKTYFNYSSAIEYKNKSSYSNDTWTTMVKGELDENRPMEYCGQDPENTSSGHAFVCDGYNNEDYFHFNWGWSGHFDGYFSLDNLNTGANNESGSGNGVYTFGQAAIFGIEPKSSITAPTLSASVNQNTITLSWNAIEGSTYDVYKNNVKIGSEITTTSYVDTNIEFGVFYEYYVRAVSSNTRSNPSNLITMMSDYRDFTPYDLTLAYNEGNVTFNWNGYHGGASIDLHYGVDNTYYVKPEGHFYWGQKYLANTLSNYAGMYIDQLSVDLLNTGNYTAYLYKTNTSNITNQLLQQDFTVTQIGWNTISIDNPIILDVSEDLWIVFYYYASGNNNKLPIDYYYGDNAQYANYKGSSLETIDESYYGNNVSWPISIHLTDGAYTYNLYEGTNPEPIASGISETSYMVSNIVDNTVHQYTVKTNYYAGESAASNTASLALGSNTLESLTLANNDNITIGNGSSLTVTGILSNTNPDNLVLEDGAQLYTESENVYATVKKSIAGYGDDNAVKTGWNFIASPIVAEGGIEPTAVDSLIGNAIPETNPVVYDYDLYRLSPSDTMWENYHKHNDFRLVNGQGYLYAKNSNTTLKFSGIIKPFSTVGNANQVPLVDGWNLIGNPYTFNVYSNKSYYKITIETIDGISKNVITAVTNSGEAIAPCSGIVVKSNGTNSVTFNTSANQWANSDNGSIQMTLAQTVTTRNGINKETLDNAIVSFNEDCQLEKFYFGDNNASIYIPKDGGEYAIQCAEVQGEIPVNFRTAENGSFTLTINPEGVEMNYLHLIDNITGVDVDLLTNPSYTFEAKITDYESRFKIVFASGSVFGDGASTGSASFAFFNNGQWIINNNGGSTVQVLDVTGRILRSERISGGCDIQINYAPGVYVLRLINGEKVRTQKIVIE